MEILMAAALGVLICLVGYAVHRLNGLYSAVSLLEKRNAVQAAALEGLGQALREADRPEREEVSAEMQEGFDNLMRYSVGMARGKEKT